MRKILLLLAFMFSFATLASSQNMYVSGGAGISEELTSYSAEVGIYTDKVWFSVGYDYTTVTTDKFVSAKVYYKLVEDNKVALYSYNAFKSSVGKTNTLYFEPGIAFVYNFGKFAPQFTATAPISQYGKATLYYGVGINYWIKLKK